MTIEMRAKIHFVLKNFAFVSILIIALESQADIYESKVNNTNP